MEDDVPGMGGKCTTSLSSLELPVGAFSGEGCRLGCGAERPLEVAWRCTSVKAYSGASKPSSTVWPAAGTDHRKASKASGLVASCIAEAKQQEVT